MPIFDSIKVIFIHIPKTAGTSILNLLNLENEIMLTEKNKKNVYFGFKNEIIIDGLDTLVEYTHLTSQLLQKLEPDKFANYYKFAIVRNPYDRIVSEYFFKDCRQYELVNICDDFKSFVKNIKKNYKNIQSQSHFMKCHFMAQHEFIYDENNKCIVDKVIKFENFNTEIKELLEQLKIDKEICHLNKTTHDSWIKYYDEETSNIIYEIYQKDFELFNYNKLNFTQ